MLTSCAVISYLFLPSGAAIIAELSQFSYCLKMYYSTKRAMLSDPSEARELQVSKPENRKSQETNQGLKIPVIPETTEIDLS